jgi:hypothetical protein
MWLKRLLRRTDDGDFDSELKNIDYLGGLLNFSIPEHWVEEYGEEGGGIFYRNAKDSGTLRLDVMTFESGPDAERIDVDREVKEKAAEYDGVAVMLDEGNAYVRYDEESSEEGQQLKIRYWNIYNPVRPNHLRIAVFSYTLLASQFSDPRFQQELEMFEEQIAKAQFATELGQTN